VPSPPVAAMGTITVPVLGWVITSPTGTTTVAGDRDTVSGRIGEAAAALPVVVAASTGPTLSEPLRRAAACRLFRAVEVAAADVAVGAGTAVGEGAGASSWFSVAC
jgi:hypothetical protein